MSYRLVDANILADKYPEVNDMPCVYADLPNGLNGAHYNFPAEDTDLISRKAVIKAFNDDLEENYSGGFFLEEMFTHEEAIDIIDKLPTATPTRPKAKWIKVDEHLYECSCCGYNYKNYDGQVMKFCMNCGSVMEGGE